jgi:hypothetical protein
MRSERCKRGGGGDRVSRGPQNIRVVKAAAAEEAEETQARGETRGRGGRAG